MNGNEAYSNATSESLRWFHGIGWDTQMSQIGWTYVVLAAALVVMCVSLYQIVKAFRDD